MLAYKTPGVYIVEQPATGPIAGVGTNTAAVIGPALKGPINVPTKITSWTQFRDQFGEWIAQPGFYLAYAVRGYFDNGGTVAYVTRVGTAARAALDLADRGAGTALRVEALSDGLTGNGLQVTVQDAQIVAPLQNARVRKESAVIASAANGVIKLGNIADASRFKSGDVVTIETTAERVTIDRVRQDELVLASNLTGGPYAAGMTVRIADVVVGQKTFRVENPAGLEPGSVIHLAQGATEEDLVVSGLSMELVTVAGAGASNGYALGGGDPDVEVTTFEFTLVVTPPAPATPETFANLSMDSRHSRYFSRVIQSQYVKVTLSAVPSVEPPPDNRPAVIAATNLAGGANDNLAAIGLVHYQQALEALEKIDDVNLVCIPDRTDTGAQAALIAHCEKLGDRFAILDAPLGAPPFGAGSVLEHRAAVESARGHAALYYPWITINDPKSLTGEETMRVPPSGHLAGIYARSDTERGVHKAPANELIRGAVGLERIVDDAENGELNVEGVNVLRIFPGKARPTVWGARTTAPKDLVAWRYINVRRLFLFIEESVLEGFRWAVFEPNDTALWKKLHRTLTEFLTRVWRSGALFGRTAEEAFYVKIDEELNPPNVRALGQVIIEVGIAPVRPAEFVIVQIGMWDGGSDVNEA
jgi:uncharacterized protein